MLWPFPTLTKLANVLPREFAINANYHLYNLSRRAKSMAYGPQPPARKNSVAIVRLDLIGDFVLFTAALPHYRQIWPEARIALVGNTVWRDLALWLNANGVVTSDRDLFDEFVGIDPVCASSPTGFFKAVREISRFNILVNAAASRTNAAWSLPAMETSRRTLSSCAA